MSGYDQSETDRTRHRVSVDVVTKTKNWRMNIVRDGTPFPPPCVCIHICICMLRCLIDIHCIYFFEQGEKRWETFSTENAMLLMF